MIKKQIGIVYVDSGTIHIGDPCYTTSKDASHVGDNWSDLCHKSFEDEENGISQPFGEGIGLWVSTLHGDGVYPVYGHFKEGSERPKKVSIEF